MHASLVDFDWDTEEVEATVTGQAKEKTGAADTPMSAKTRHEDASCHLNPFNVDSTTFACIQNNTSR